MVKKLLLVLFLGVSFTGNCQSNFIGGWLPKVNASLKLSDKTKLVNSIEVREVVCKDDFQFTHNLVDISTVFSMKMDLNHSINVGYILRLKEGETIHRFLQHFNIIQNFDNIKLAYCFGFEQFFQTNVHPQYRIRYRATLQKALNGEKVDVSEWYFKLSNEYLYQFNQEDLEVRLSPYLGYQLSKKDKLEFGLDYRLGKLLDEPKKNSLWFRTTWYINI